METYRALPFSPLRSPSHFSGVFFVRPYLPPQASNRLDSKSNFSHLDVVYNFSEDIGVKTELWRALQGREAAQLELEIASLHRLISSDSGHLRR
ncbi:hypothetical protein RchiOBHm_Chr2g0131311 [Rosa chinensis]|uniref:Uncharacterized protein n=1 Tax=Rosa chinensis TaxID=74649 RepID=A0A2P6RV11_ROSCH|nr:hypothetical protein RchiOBHm_Chr2g0131311 [Rosa chinensis]